MKVTIEIEIPETVDLAHTYRAVSDALDGPENVTQAEYDLVTGILDRLVPRKKYEVSRVRQVDERIVIEASSKDEAFEIAKSTCGIEWERQDLWVGCWDCDEL